MSFRKFFISITSILILTVVMFYFWINWNKYNRIPNVIIQTYYDKTKIPEKVWSNIKRYAKNYKHLVYDDKECYNFILKEYGEKYANVFNHLIKGAHKADLFRYCYLYKYGGIYLDIKTELIKNIEDIFSNKYRGYTVISKNSNQIYQGIIATVPNRKIFKILIEHIVSSSQNITNYHIFTEKFYDELKIYNKQSPMPGRNSSWYLFQEKCIQKDNKKVQVLCKDGLDRYGYCCYVYDNGSPIIKTRYPDFPW